MTITISSKTAGAEPIYEGLTEARMDEESQQLSNNKEGICSVGQASCYALIVRNSSDSVLWHICNGLEVCGKETKQAINNLKSSAPNDEINIILVRSKAAFAENQAEEKLHNPDDTYETVEQYIKNTDDEYLEELEKNLQRFNITPQFIDMPHDFLVINSKNELCIFEQYTADEIKWTSVKPNKKAKKSINQMRKKMLLHPAQVATTFLAWKRNRILFSAQHLHKKNPKAISQQIRVNDQANIKHIKEQSCIENTSPIQCSPF